MPDQETAAREQANEVLATLDPETRRELERTARNRGMSALDVILREVHATASHSGARCGNGTAGDSAPCGGDADG